MQKNKKTNKTQTWFSNDAFIMLAIAFIIIETVGLYAAKQLYYYGLQQPLFTQNINDPANSIILFGTILITTLLVLILIKLKKTTKLLWLIEGLALFSTSLILYSVILPENDLLVAIAVILTLILRYTNKKNKAIRNIASGIAIAGAGSFIGISLGVIPAITFLAIIAAYDIIAVYYTKHMIEIGQQATKNNFAFTIMLPAKKHSFELGNGDLVIPLMMASSILVNGRFQNNGLIAGLCLGASFIGLMISIYLVSKKKIAMPALPPQTILMIITLGIAILLGL